MPSVTRTPTCTVKGCPAPKDPDWHIPWCQDIPGHECFGGATHQHVPKRSQGGKKIVACLCVGAHDRIDNGTDWGNSVITKADGTLVYWAFDLHGKTLIEREVMPNAKPPTVDQREVGRDAGRLSDGAEGEGSKVPPSREEPMGSAEVPEPLEARSGGQPSAPSLSKEESDGRTPSPSHSGDAGRAGVPLGARPQPSLAVPLTHDQRVAIAQEPEWAELDSVAQEEWFQKLVSDCCEIGRAEHGGVINSKWYMGARICGEENLWDAEGPSGRLRVRHGLIARLTEELGKEFKDGHGYGVSSLTKSIRFARKCAEDEIRNVVTQFGTWRRIVHEYLPDNPRESEPLEPLEIAAAGAIIIDPPWPMSPLHRDTIPDDRHTLDYPTQTVEAIKEWLEKSKLPDAYHLYLWTTQRFLRDAFAIMEETLKVEPQVLLVWHKSSGFVPFSWMYNAEFVVFGRKGGLELEKIGEKVVFGGKVREHSRKPDDFYDLVRRVSPAPRYDIFSRETRQGFEQWGDERDKFDDHKRSG